MFFSPRPALLRLRPVLLLGLLSLASGAACFGMITEPARHFYILHIKAVPPGEEAHVDGLIRVRDIDAESAYDRLQMVVRKNTYELGYRPRDTWAVKPGRMLSDLLARALAEHNTFDGVTRELSERRPDYLLSGDLHALEVEQAGHLWQARLALTLQVTDMDTGDVLWTGNYDERDPCASHDFGAAVEAFSRALGRITATMLKGLRDLPARPHPTAAHAPLDAGRRPAELQTKDPGAAQ